MEQTKLFLKLKGKIWGLNNKDIKDFGLKRNLSFGIQTSKDNSLFLQVGEWANSKMNVKLKAEGMDKPESFLEQEAIDQIKALFKDGDSIFVKIRAEIDTYNRKLTLLVSEIYIENEPIDFESADFEEVNEMNMPAIIIEKPANRSVTVGLVNYQGEMLEQELKLSDDDVNEYFAANVKVGDLMKLSVSVNRKPNYVDGEVEQESSEPVRKTLKGKSVSGGGYKKRNIDGYTESLEVTDIDLDKDEKQKYTKDEIREALSKAQEKQDKKAESKLTDKEAEDASGLVDEDLPF